MCANTAGESMLRKGDGLLLSGRELRARTPAETSSLRQNIAMAVADRPSAGGSQSTMVLSRARRRRPLSIHVLPLTETSPLLDVHHGAAAVVCVVDPEQVRVPDIEGIRTAFHLTPAEAGLVQCLTAGLSLTEAADQIGIRVDTARKRLKQVFQKTDTHRQADLVRLVLRYAAPAEPSPSARDTH